MKGKDLGGLSGLMFGCCLLLGAGAEAQTCPVQFGNGDYLTNVIAEINNTKNCEQGSAIAEACALGASGDVQIAGAAEKVCRLDFWRKLAATDKNNYLGLRDRCVKKYDQPGSLYLSMAVFCQLKVARLYSDLYTPFTE